MQGIEKNGRPERTRAADLYRVKFEVQKLNSIACVAFPFLDSLKSPSNGSVLVTNW
jgi:hypothetical protein